MSGRRHVQTTAALRRDLLGLHRTLGRIEASEGVWDPEVKREIVALLSALVRLYTDRLTASALTNGATAPAFQVPQLSLPFP